jgi:TonB family protein
MSSRTRILTGLLLTGALALTGSAVFAQRIERPEALRLTGEDASSMELLRGDSPQQHYPEAARKAGYDGSAIVDLLLNESGQVLEAQVVSESPKDMGFGLAALDTAKTFEFENRLKRLVLLTVTIEFEP